MKLAEALRLRSDYGQRLEDLHRRVERNMIVQEGDEPQEDPSKLTKEYDEVCSQLVKLVSSINLINAEIKIKYDIRGRALQEMTMTQALAERDILKKKIQMYRSTADGARLDQKFSYFKSEIKFRAVLEIPPIQKTIDDLSANLRGLDVKIQEANWLEEYTERV
ncbi:hypothetical protein JA9_002998 [Meyerozyma sp. JA9]|nr:hypothetical protein JA9_002998 [Meyerozyma sp. JA9]